MVELQCTLGIYENTAFLGLCDTMIQKKNTCKYGDCKKRAAIIVGDCSFCRLKFCSAHRLPEVHSCIGIDECKKLAVGRNSAILISGKCVGSKI